MSKVSMMPGVQTPPAVFVDYLREHADKIEHIACVIQWNKTESGKPTVETQVCSTTMPTRDAAYLRWCFDQEFPTP